MTIEFGERLDLKILHENFEDMVSELHAIFDILFEDYNWAEQTAPNEPTFSKTLSKSFAYCMAAKSMFEELVRKGAIRQMTEEEKHTPILQFGSRRKNKRHQSER